MLKKLEIESKFLQGLRVTDQKTLEVAQMVLCGAINKDISGMISAQPGVRGAIGLCGLDGKLIQAKTIDKMIVNDAGENVKLDLGLVGDPTIVNTQLLKDLLSIGLVPVIAPIGSNEVGGTSLNINADTAAGSVAEALKVRNALIKDFFFKYHPNAPCFIFFVLGRQAATFNGRHWRVRQIKESARKARLFFFIWLILRWNH
jgi:acetylglutamate kinase